LVNADTATDPIEEVNIHFRMYLRNEIMAV
jgi:hypothetical protein